MGRQAVSPFIALDDGVGENRATGALAFCLQHIPRFLGALLPRDILPEEMAEVESSELLRWIPGHGELDAIFSLNARLPVRYVILETKIVETGHGVSPRPTDESEQLPRYANAARDWLRRPTILVYLTKDNVAPEPFERLTAWLEQNPIPDLHTVWWSWNEVYRVGKEISESGRITDEQVHFLDWLFDFVEARAMVTNKLTPDDERSLRKLPADMKSIWLKLHPKGRDMLSALREHLKAKAKAANTDIRFWPEGKGVGVYSPKEDIPAWFLHVRWGHGIPISLCYDLEFMIASFDLTIRPSGLGKNPEYAAWLRESKDKIVSKVAKVYPAAKWVRSPDDPQLEQERMIILERYERGEDFADFSVERMLELADIGKRIIDECLTPPSR